MTERRELQAGIAHLRDRHRHERDYQRAELAVMMSMMRDSTREQFQDHAQQVDGRKDELPRDAMRGATRPAATGTKARIRPGARQGPQPA
jgi:hypothetical protein